MDSTSPNPLDPGDALRAPSPHRGLLGRPPGLPWKRLAGAALVAAAGAAGAVFALSTIDPARGAADTWLRLGAGVLSLAGGLLGLMEFHRRRTQDIARGRVVGPMADESAGPSAIRTAAGLALSLLAVATVLAMSVDVAVQMTSSTAGNRRSGLDALRDARNRKDPDAADAAQANPTDGPGGGSGLVSPDTSGRSRGAVDGEALGNLLSDEPVFEVLDETPAPSGTTRSTVAQRPLRPLLLRGFVIDGFDAKGTLRERSGTSVALGGRDQTHIDRPYSQGSPRTESVEGRTLDLRFRFFRTNRGLIFSPHELIRLDAERAELDQGTLALTASLAGLRTYSLRARVPAVGSTALSRAKSKGSLPIGHEALSLPPVRSKSRLRANRALDRLSSEVTKDARSDMARVLAVVQHLRTSFAYELYHVDFLNPEGCAQLMDRGAGSCTHFASMATLMLRRLGIPTRIAAGYVARESLGSGETVDSQGTLKDRNPSDRGWIVRERDGHAWIEVHFAGIGWLPFDPTPGDATVGGALAGWSPLAEELEPGGRRGERSRTTTALAALARAGMDALGKRGISGFWLLLAAGGVLVLWIWSRRRTAPLSVGPQGQETASVPVSVGGGANDPAIYALFEALAGRGFRQPPGMTPRAFARNVEGALPVAQGLEESVLAMLRAAAGRGPIAPPERAAIVDLANRIAAPPPPEI